MNPSSARPRSRQTAVALSGVAIAALAGGTAWWLDDTAVSLSVDGQERTVSTRGDTVQAVLASAGLTVGEHDVLTPDATTRVGDGDRVALRRGRPVELTVDGAKRTVWTTAESVDEALAQVGVRDEGAVLSASRSRRIGTDGLTLTVRTPKDISILVDGRVKALTTTAPTVRDALIKAGVKLRAADRLSAKREAALQDRMVLRVTRIDGKRATEDVEIPYRTVRRPDATTYRGETRVIEAGRPGILERSYTVNFVNGRQKSKFLGKAVRTAEPVTRVIGVGTKARPAPVAPRSERFSASALNTGGGLNWAGVARCESGGNPRAASPNGLYYGLYQFDLQTWRAVGGTGNPVNASPAEQTARAQRLYDQRGAAPWPVCGRHL